MTSIHRDRVDNAEAEPATGERPATAARARQPLERLLVALDFAGASDLVLARLLLLPLARDAHVALLSVVPHDVSGPVHGGLRADLALRLEQTAARMLQAARGQGMRELTVSTEVADGHPSDQVVRCARERDAELIVLGQHSRARPLLDRFVGSTAHNVITHSEVPVLVVSRGAEAPYRRPLLATAFDAASARAMQVSLRTIDPLVHDGVVLHAYHSPLLGGPDVASAASPDRAKFDEHFRTLAQMSLNAFMEQHANPDFAWRFLLRSADARTAIVSEARQHGADLVVLGTHARTGLSHVLLGSVAERVTMDAECDVLIANTRAPLSAG